MIDSSPHTIRAGRAQTFVETDLPRWPLGWYVVARTRDLKVGGIVSGELGGKSYVLFRSEEGVLNAIQGHCPHMGAHLAHGKVIGEELRCALHYWCLDGRGRARGPGADGEGVNVWPVRERFGLIFLFLGSNQSGAAAQAMHDDDPHPESMPLPAPQAADEYVWTTGPPVELQTDWHSMAINGFDMLHLHAVHNRQLTQPAEFVVLDDNRLELRYVSRVTGKTPSDLIMKWLSGNRIRVRQTCYGSVIVVETQLLRTRTTAVLGLLDQSDSIKEPRIRAFSAFGIEPGPLAGLRLAATRWLYAAFLRRDFAILEGMRLRVDVADEGVRALAEFLRGRPRMDA